MRALGFSFKKIDVEKLASNSLEGVKVNANIDISDITPAKSTDMIIKPKEDLIGIKFNYTVNYDPDYAKLIFSGDILIELDSKTAKEILKSWKDKEMPEEFRIFVFNIILRKSNLKALELEDEMNLPLHIPMPSIQKEEVKNQ
jgi:hypothetical protein